MYYRHPHAEPNPFDYLAHEPNVHQQQPAARRADRAVQTAAVVPHEAHHHVHHDHTSRHQRKRRVQNNDSDDEEAVTCGENARTFCTSTAMHGLRYIGTVQLSRFERAFFVLIFCSVFCLSAYYISNIYDKWTASPVIITLNAIATNVGEIPFPAITICNANQARRDAIDQFTEESGDFFLLRSLCRSEVNVSSAVRPNNTNWSHFKDFLKRVSRPCDDLLLTCQYGSTKLRCGDVFTTVLTDEGFCCNFNGVHRRFLLQDHVSDAENYEFLFSNMSSSGRDRYRPIEWTPEKGFNGNRAPKTYPRRGLGSGSHMGLTVMGSVHAKDYYCSSTNSAGFKVLMHPPTETPKIADFGQTIGAGRENHIIITPHMSDASKQIRAVPIKQRQCVFGDEMRLDYFRTYSRKNCEMECESRLLMRICGCVLFFMPRMDDSVKICNRDDVDCSQEVKLTIEQVNNHTYTCDCLPGCFEINYKADVSTARLGSGFRMRQSLLNRESSTFASENFVVMHFYYTHKYFRGEQKEELIGFTEFLSNTGGLLGLFMGFSVISIVEIVYFMTIRPYCAIKRISERRLQKANYAPQTDGGIIDNRAIVTISNGMMKRPIRVKFRQTAARRISEVDHGQGYTYTN